MAGLKPLELVELFEELGYRLARSSESIRSLVREAESTQVHLLEHKARFKEQAQIQTQLILDDLNALAKVKDSADSARAESVGTLADLQAVQQQATQTLTASVKKLDSWKREESSARSALHEAQAELSRAQAAVEEAMYRESRAESALESAKASLQSCENKAYNKDGRRVRNCSSEEGAVFTAKQQLDRARADLQIATGRRVQAEQAVRAAETRLETAVRSVATAKSAVSVSKSGESDAVYSVSEASRAAELADLVCHATEKVSDVCEKQQDLVEELSKLSEQLNRECDEAAQMLKQVNVLHNAVEHLSLCCRNDLALRAEDLRRVEARYSF